MTTLFISPFTGEFGWILFCHQAYCRQAATRFDACIVACHPDHAYLYQDFATRIVPIDLHSWNQHTFKARRFDQVSFDHQFGCELGPDDEHFPSNEALCQYDWQESELDDRFQQQTFKQLGDFDDDLSYDIVIHARNRRKAANRNWPERKWRVLLSEYPNARVACVGTIEDSLHVGGDDLRGSNLQTVCNVLASSACVVSPSSGIVHLAALCQGSERFGGCVTWYGSPYDERNEVRYSTDWNPFFAPVKVLHCSRWDIDPEWVADGIEDMLYRILTKKNSEGFFADA